jgi:hypothetical protein
MSDFWREHKGSLIITFISLFLGACIQIGLMFMKPALQPQPVITQPEPVVAPLQPKSSVIVVPAPPIIDKYHHERKRW